MLQTHKPVMVAGVATQTFSMNGPWQRRLAPVKEQDSTWPIWSTSLRSGTQAFCRMPAEEMFENIGSSDFCSVNEVYAAVGSIKPFADIDSASDVTEEVKTLCQTGKDMLMQDEDVVEVAAFVTTAHRPGKWSFHVTWNMRDAHGKQMCYDCVMAVQRFIEDLQARTRINICDMAVYHGRSSPTATRVMRTFGSRKLKVNADGTSSYPAETELVTLEGKRLRECSFQEFCDSLLTCFSLPSRTIKSGISLFVGEKRRRETCTDSSHKKPKQFNENSQILRLLRTYVGTRPTYENFDMFNGTYSYTPSNSRFCLLQNREHRSNNVHRTIHLGPKPKIFEVCLDPDCRSQLKNKNMHGVEVTGWQDHDGFLELAFLSWAETRVHEPVFDG